MTIEEATAFAALSIDMLRSAGELPCKMQVSVIRITCSNTVVTSRNADESMESQIRLYGMQGKRLTCSPV